jgi:serine/threonine-protein kinase TTK/MPS1
MIGKGGSSRVYKVLSHSNQMFAVKRVSLDRTDQETMSGYMNEISLLKRLEGNHRIIRLIDSEVKAGPDGSKGHLTLVMELGEIGAYAAVALHWKLTALPQIWRGFCMIS